MTGREAAGLVARRELVERTRERSFQVSVLVTMLIVVLVALLPPLLGLGGDDEYTVAADPASVPVAAAAARAAPAFDAKIAVERIDPGQARAAVDGGDADVALADGRLVSKEDPDDKLVGLLQDANRSLSTTRALERAGVRGAQLREAVDPPPLALDTLEPVNEAREKRGGLAFIAVIVLYGQIVTFGYWVAMGVVEEKSTRVVEVILATIRPRQLLAGKVVGIGLLGLVQLLVTAIVGLAVAQLAGALEVDGDVLVVAALALGWFVVGYAFYASAFAVAGALVPRQEELQSTITPLTMTLLLSFFLTFAVHDNPDGGLATVTSFIPMCAPMTMPTRIALGEAPAVEIVAAFVVTAGAAAALVPLAGRVYTGAVLRTGAAVKLGDAWRAARAS